MDKELKVTADFYDFPGRAPWLPEGLYPQTRTSAINASGSSRHAFAKSPGISVYSQRTQYDRVFHSSTENLVRAVYFPVTYAMEAAGKLRGQEAAGSELD